MLGESLPIAGTPYALNYRSNRVAGRSIELKIPLTGATPHPQLDQVTVRLQLAGRSEERRFAPQPNQSTTFVWDGKDAYGRPVQGQAPLSIAIAYRYPAAYSSPAALRRSFGYAGAGLITVPDAPLAARSALAAVNALQAVVTRQPAYLWQRYDVQLRALDAGRRLGLGGWTIDPVHFYDPNGRQLDLGDGHSRANLTPAQSRVLDRAPLRAGPDAVWLAPDDIRPRRQPLSARHRRQWPIRFPIMRIGLDNSVQSVAGGGSRRDFDVRPVPANQASIGDIRSIATDAAGGNLYLVSNNALLQLDRAGMPASWPEPST